MPHGGRLGIFGFGGSAHLVAQVALAEGTEVHVFTRSAKPASWRCRWGVLAIAARIGILKVAEDA